MSRRGGDAGDRSLVSTANDPLRIGAHVNAMCGTGAVGRSVRHPTATAPPLFHVKRVVPALRASEDPSVVSSELRAPSSKRLASSAEHRVLGRSDVRDSCDARARRGRSLIGRSSGASYISSRCRLVVDPGSVSKLSVPAEGDSSPFTVSRETRERRPRDYRLGRPGVESTVRGLVILARPPARRSVPLATGASRARCLA